MCYRPRLGISGSEWIGLQHFKTFFTSRECIRVIRNTFTISFLSILFGFPAPILLALLLNEVHNSGFKRVVQTVSYLPHFVSIVVICGLLKTFCLSNGVFNQIITFFGGTDQFITGGTVTDENGRFTIPVEDFEGTWTPDTQ